MRQYQGSAGWHHIVQDRRGQLGPRFSTFFGSDSGPSGDFGPSSKIFRRSELVQDFLFFRVLWPVQLDLDRLVSVTNQGTLDHGVHSMGPTFPKTRHVKKNIKTGWDPSKTRQKMRIKKYDLAKRGRSGGASEQFWSSTTHNRGSFFNPGKNRKSK